MRNLPDNFTGGAMTLCHCWRLMRSDGLIFGFTDHDADLALDGVLYMARSGVASADMTSATGFAVTGGEMSGALTSLGLTESDIAAGLYDNARIDLLLVDWASPDIHILLSSGVVGEIKRHGGAFIAELRGIAALYQEEKGRRFGRSCAADLGDTQCRVNLDDPRYAVESVVTATNGATYFECAVDATTYDFTNGRVNFLSGANAGRAYPVKSQSANAASSGLFLWQSATAMMVVGDRVKLSVGCDKSFSTCRTRFANQINFRGFPHMPGNDFVLAVAKNGDANFDGGSLFNG